ncbi:uncharacterized protein LOC116343826 [Contarinia nasturtii]|uniref:uncharacterized protein LOC116343826 n=1 Tax=Contarinia nasturtii TaxID=265458 RepID=UPI0012D4A66E|nr:uncharacterized protein LOC116343826 [Contarinia nasturtii]
MKQYLFYCAIISAVALINGYSIELDNIELLSGEFFNYDDHRITDEQRKCVEDGINKIKDENANLKPWFDDIEKTANTITKLSEKCYALNGVAQKICFKFLGRFVSAQRKRLFGNLTEEQKEVLDNVKKILKECLKEETAPGVIKIPFDDNDESEINVKEFLEMRFNFFPSNANTEEQINCIKVCVTFSYTIHIVTLMGGCSVAPSILEGTSM